MEPGDCCGRVSLSASFSRAGSVDVTGSVDFAGNMAAAGEEAEETGDGKGA